MLSDGVGSGGNVFVNDKDSKLIRFPLLCFADVYDVVYEKLVFVLAVIDGTAGCWG